MKNILITLLAAATIALGAAYVMQLRKATEQRTEIASLRSEADQRSREIADLQSSQKLLQQQRREFLDQSSRLATELQARKAEERATAANPAIETPAQTDDEKPAGQKSPIGQFLAQMMDDPETRKLIRHQQRMMLNTLYDPLIKKMGLTPENAEQFKDLLADNMMKGVEKAGPLFDGASATNRAELMASMRDQQKDTDEQIRGFLGEGNYALYKDYQETVNERTQLGQFRQQFATGESAISDAQAELLLTFMKEEKKNVAANTGQPAESANQDMANMEAMFSGDNLEKLLQTQESLNQRVYERAQEYLSQSQLDAFGRFQTNQLQMMRMGMTMTRKFMATEETGNAPENP